SQVSEVLFFPETAIVYPWLVAQASLETAMANGIQLFLDSPVLGLEKDKTGFQVITPNQVLNTKVVVNAAGLGAEKVV
ncbi:MAG: FAD-dependent oxidoreductase, partial [Allobaculum sp.]|nr:FAD-dependent oxidoreductase [Allobaculum sp.]